MEMTNREIARRYRAGKNNKEDVIAVLAQLNACSRWAIVRSLLAEGVSEQEIGAKYIDKAKKKQESDELDRARESRSAEVAAKRKDPEQKQDAGKATATKRKTTKQTAEKKERMTAQSVKKIGEAPETRKKSAINEAMQKLDEIETELRVIQRQRDKLSRELRIKEAEYLDICRVFGIKSKGKE